MKENKKILKRKERGITLIALVITIIVLLILAGVSIAMLTGDNGILTQAQNAKDKTEQASEAEKIQLAVMATSMDNNGYTEILDTDSFKQELQNQFGSEEVNVTPNGDGSFIVTVNDRKYYVNDDKTVISNDNIIEIGTKEELEAFRDDVNSGNSYEGKVVLLTSDITLSEEWEPIGFMDKDTDAKNPETGDSKPFKGIFDGGNHIIKNLNMSSTDNRFNSLFAFVIDGTIRNITIGENSEISGSSGAGVVGFLYGFEGNISNCINYANTNCAGIVKVIAGQHIIFNCKNYGTINSQDSVAGGIVGNSNGDDWKQFENVSNTIINCGNYGNVIKESGTYCAGIVGFFKGNILNSFNIEEINSQGASVGGIVGEINGNIENCYNIANISGVGDVGGITGRLTGNIKNCYSIANITGNYSVGIFSGVIHTGTVENCYSKDDEFNVSNLGNAFKEDTNNINDGYPILQWQ